MFSVIRANYPDRQQELKSEAFVKLARAALIRDKGACTQCDFVAGKYARVVHEDNEYGHVDGTKLFTLCPFCFYAHRLELADTRGRVIFLPEANQVQLNYIVHGCWSILNRQADLDNALCYSIQTNLTFLLDRAEPVETVFNSKLASQPKYLAQMLKSCSDEEYKARTTVLKDLRLLPIRQGYAEELIYWGEKHYKNIINDDAKKWESIGSRIGLRTLTPKT